ncbi:hypothetical protein LT493_17765 [Streptomyces tricolor]|nr:hypothetical protein [Streptomyces tricolor]
MSPDSTAGRPTGTPPSPPAPGRPAPAPAPAARSVLGHTPRTPAPRPRPGRSPRATVLRTLPAPAADRSRARRPLDRPPTRWTPPAPRPTPAPERTPCSAATSSAGTC